VKVANGLDDVARSLEHSVDLVKRELAIVKWARGRRPENGYEEASVWFYVRGELIRMRGEGPFVAISTVDGSGRADFRTLCAFVDLYFERDADRTIAFLAECAGYKEKTVRASLERFAGRKLIVRSERGCAGYALGPGLLEAIERVMKLDVKELARRHAAP